MILGNNVYERIDKSPEDVMKAIFHKDEEEAATLVQEVTPTPIEFTHDLLGRIIEGVQEYFWAQSSYTTMYCTLRDVFAYTVSMRGFENIVQVLYETHHLDYACPPNTLATTIRNNGYMKYRTDRWEQHRAKSNSLKLMRAVINFVNSIR